MVLRSFNITEMEQQHHHFGPEPTFMPSNAHWTNHDPYNQQHASPDSDYGSYNYNATLPQPQPFTYSPYTPRQGPTLLTTPLPSQFINQLSYQTPVHGHPPPLLTSFGNAHANAMAQPVSAPPIVPSSGRPHAPTPRRTLTNADRRRMCLYKRDNPTKKQTDIGAIFGVERSTVSKVWTQRARYLSPSEGGLSTTPPPTSKPLHRPNIARTLDAWATNQETLTGTPLSDEQLMQQARFFAASTGGTDVEGEFGEGWLREFKVKRREGGFRGGREGGGGGSASGRRVSKAGVGVKEERKGSHSGASRRATVATPGSSGMSRASSEAVSTPSASPSSYAMPGTSTNTSLSIPSNSTSTHGHLLPLGPDPAYAFTSTTQNGMDVSPTSGTLADTSPYTFSTHHQQQQYSPHDTLTSRYSSTPSSMQIPLPLPLPLPSSYSTNIATLPSTRPYQHHHHQQMQNSQQQQYEMQSQNGLGQNTARAHLDTVLSYIATHPGDADEAQVAVLKKLGQRWRSVG